MKLHWSSYCLFCVFHFIIAHTFAQTIFTIHGKVIDDSTNEPLAAANIRVLGTSKGTITNNQGDYVLSLEKGSYVLVYSYLAYVPETVNVKLDESIVHNVLLKPSPIQMPEVVVLAEDPAIEIIRKAIANKRKWMDKIKSYKFDAFTRQVLRRDTAIASITESYSTGYLKIGDTLREIVKQKRQTENIPGTENFAAVHRIINFNEDEIRLFGVGTQGKYSAFSFVGPTAPDALDYYDYKLLETSVLNGVEIYRIQIIPKSRIRPLFKGTITIADETFAVMGVDLKPNETFTIPFIKDLELNYRQQFALYDTLFWMPIDNRISGGLSISIVGISMPRIGIDITSSIYNYEINTPIPDSILHKPKLSIDSSAVKFDSTFWSQNEVLPLSQEEQKAYKTLDSTQSLEKQFQPSGPLASLTSDGTNKFLEHIDARFNRVEGFFFGGKLSIDSLTKFISFNSSIGYGFTDKRLKYKLGVKIYPGKKRNFSIGGNYYYILDNIPDEGYYEPLAISLMALIDKNDYRDYFLAKGWRTFFDFSPTKKINTSLIFTNEKHFSLQAIENYSLFLREKSFRMNPPIDEGNLRAIGVELRYGDEPVPLNIIPRDALEITIEHSSQKIFKSDFDYSRIRMSIDYNFNTFAQNLLFPPLIKIKVIGGFGIGTLPRQRVFVADSRASGYAPFGVLKAAGVKEFGGDRLILINLEHNFRSIPFLALNIPFLYRSSIELIAFGSLAQTWTGKISTSGGWYYEGGLGISRIFDILRADFTYRFREPRRIYFTICLASIF